MKIKSKAFKSIGKLAKKKVTVAKKLASPPGLQKLLKKQPPSKVLGSLLNKVSKKPGLLKNEKFLAIIKDLVAKSPNRDALKRLAENFGKRAPTGSSTPAPATPPRIGFPERDFGQQRPGSTLGRDQRIGFPERDFGQQRPGSTLGRDQRIGFPERDFGQQRPGSVLKDPLVLLFAARQAQL